MHSLAIPAVQPCPRCDATTRRDTEIGVECARCGYPLEYPAEDRTAEQIIREMAGQRHENNPHVSREAC